LCPPRFERLDSVRLAPLNANVQKNQHRWKKSVDDYIRRVLEDAAEGLASARASDMKHPRRFPMNTDAMFDRIKSEIQEYQLGDRPKLAHKPSRLPRPRPPRCLSDLADEQTIRVVYESQNVGTYDEALRVVAWGKRAASRTFQKILNARIGGSPRNSCARARPRSWLNTHGHSRARQLSVRSYGSDSPAGGWLCARLDSQPALAPGMVL
jgi:hypothetical protein